MAQFVDSRTLALQEQSSKLILGAHSSPIEDIKAERQRATLNSLELAAFLHGGREKLERRQLFAEAMSKTSWGDKSRRNFLTREEEYVGGLKGALGIWDKMKKEKLGLEEGAVLRQLLDFPGGLELHIGMFIPTILSQATADQQAEWLPKCYSLEVIGTYAQTEMGHGTFVRGLETTATFDAETQEFIIHSPTLTATKWWPGGMGKTASHAVVMARLILKGKDYGPHAFIVQLRSLTDHRPLPGITVGDIGPKFGFGGVDNGFMRMEYVRIPRDRMLMRYSKVTPEGDYVPPPPSNSKASYATMLYVRADIVKNAGSVLGRAVTIATRFCAIRRQTAIKPGEKETQVLDYQNCAHTLLPLVSAAYALFFMGQSMWEMYNTFEADRDRGDFAVLPELHALASGLKAMCTNIAADGIETCRRTCGGHGYSRLSGLPTLYASYVQNVTWEGDNPILYLQTARYLLRALLTGLKGGQVQGSAAYLSQVKAELAARSPASSPSCWDKPEVQLAALRHVAARLTAEAAEILKSAGGGQMVFEGQAWNNNTVAMIRCARAHTAYVLHKNMLDSIARIEADRKQPAATLAVLHQVATLFATSTIESSIGDFLEDGYMSGAQASSVRQRQRALLMELRPNAVALVDAFGFTDYELNSCIGRADGDIYKALYEAARASPLNDTEEGPAWESVLRPVMLRNQSRM